MLLFFSLSLEHGESSVIHTAPRRGDDDDELSPARA